MDGVHPMPTDDWKRTQEVFLASADLPVAARRSFLDRACSGDPELRREVESLLAADRDGGESIATAVARAAQELLGGDPLIGARLGHWRIEREIGRGGMGAVYLATRDDGDYRQQAAIKLIKEGMDTAQVLDRFRHERQILANLNHPYIARLIDGGSTELGRPYLVMEYVEGQPIDSWLERRNAGLEERCRLFLLVCEAVSHAHRNLVVHRDLKPGNILITPDGMPKLLDFGVAKLLAPDQDPAATAAADMRAVTPGYASPEQMLGQPVTTTTDVYSLGAILYELLTGVKACQPGSGSPEEWRRAVCETEPARPSDAAPVRLRRRLAGDLDNIAGMAMRKQPERRYASVDGLSADLRHYLAGEPVAARRDSRAYRAGKFARRHALGLGMALLVAASLLAGTTLAVMQARRAEAARRMADERLTQMVALANRSLFDIHSRIERLPGATQVRREIVATTLQFLEELRKTAGNDRGLQQALAAAYLKLGDVQGYPYGPSLGDGAGALKDYRTAAELLAPLRQSRPRDADVLDAWVEVQRRIGLLLATGGKVDEAAACLRSAMPDAALLGRLRPFDAVAASRQANLFDSMAAVLETRGPAATLEWSQRALSAFQTLAVRFPGREDILEGLAGAYSRTGTGLTWTGDLQAALTEYRQCAEVRERLVSAHPNDMAGQRDLMLAYGHIAAVLGTPLVPNLGDSEGARTYYRKAAALAGRIAAADPLNGTAQYDLAAVTLRLGILDVAPSGLEDSLAALRTAAGELESLIRASPNDSRYKSQLTIAQEYIGRRLFALGRLRESIAAYRQSLAGADAALAGDPGSRANYSQLAATSGGLVRALAASGDRAGAMAQARTAIARIEACGPRGVDEPNCARYKASAWLALGAACRVFAQSPSSSPEGRQSDWREAQAAARRALREISVIPASSCQSLCPAVADEARGLIAASAAQR